MIDSPRLGDLKAAYINAVSQSQQFQYEATRIERMAADQAVPGKNLREAQTALAQQQTTTANARQQLINLGFSAEEIASLVVDKDTGTELPLVTPWAGTIVGRHAVEGALVDRNDPLFDLADLDTMWVYLNLYEADLGRVKQGQTVTFVPDGLAGHEFSGQDRLDQSRGRRAARASRRSAPKLTTPTDCCGPTCMAAAKSSSSRPTTVSWSRRQPCKIIATSRSFSCSSRPRCLPSGRSRSASSSTALGK